jgi:S1-C subfamily serine protease
MMGNKLFSFAVATILLMGVAFNSPKIPSTQDVKETVSEQVLQNTVEIHAYVDGTISIGSGVIYMKDGQLFILTAAHVIGEGKGLYLVSQTDPDNDEIKETFTADVVAYETESDWAILRPVGVARHIGRGTTFMSLPPRVGDKVYAAGSPMGENNTVTEGIVSHRNRSVSWNKDKHYVISNNGARGLSGGGVYDIHTGKCIGIVVRQNRMANHLYIVPIQTIINDLRESGQLLLFPA